MIKTKATKKKAAKKSVSSATALARKQAVEDQAIMNLTKKRLAKMLGLSAEEFAKIKDPAVVLPALRKILAEDFGLDELPNAVSGDDYRNLIAYYFGYVLVLSAKFPLNLRREMERYIDVLNEIKKGWPKGTRKPGRDVQIALEMLDEGCEWAAIYPVAIENYGGMSKDERCKARSVLRGKVRAIKVARAVRGLSRKG